MLSNKSPFKSILSYKEKKRKRKENVSELSVTTAAAADLWAAAATATGEAVLPTAVQVREIDGSQAQTTGASDLNLSDYY